MNEYKVVLDLLDFLKMDEINLSDGETFTSPALNLFGEKTRGYFSLHLDISGGGALTVQCLASNIESDDQFTVPLLPNGGALPDILTLHPAGVVLVSYHPPISAYEKLKFTSVGDIIINKAIICYQ